MERFRTDLSEKAQIEAATPSPCMRSQSGALLTALVSQRCSLLALRCVAPEARIRTQAKVGHLASTHWPGHAVIVKVGGNLLTAIASIG